MTTPGGPIDIDLNLDAGQFVQGATQASAAAMGLSAGLAGIAGQQSVVSRALSAMTPGRALIAGFTGFSAAAAATEQRLSKLSAVEATTGQNAGKLSRGINEIARQFPVGNRGAEQMVKTLQSVGLTAEKSEKRVINLGKVFTKTAIATGEDADTIAQGMVKMSRAYGQFSPDPKRMADMSDTLVELSATTGASASGILGFSNAITPFTRQLGIGQTATMGIAASFSAMGEDGMAAGNAINKVMNDLNRSVRDGSEEINTYADLVGRTREEFMELVKTNPSQALSEVLPAFAEGGGQGARNLEAVGLDSVRMQRPLLQVAQNGGFQKYIDQAMEAEGSGATDRAAEASMAGFFDASSRVTTNMEQLAVAVGNPLLTPLNALAEAAAGVTGFFAKIASSPLGQVGIGASMVGAAGVMGLFKVLPTIVSIATGRSLATSTPVRGIAAGWALGRAGGDMDRAQQTRVGRFGAPVLDAENRDVMRGPQSRQVDRFTRPILWAAAGAGEEYSRAQRESQHGAALRINERYDRLQRVIDRAPDSSGAELAKRQQQQIDRRTDPRSRGRRMWENTAFTVGQGMEFMGRLGAETVSQGLDPTMKRRSLFRAEGDYVGLFGRDGREGALRQQWNKGREDGGLAGLTKAVGNSVATVGVWTRTVHAGTSPMGALVRGTGFLTKQFWDASKSVGALAITARDAAAGMAQRGAAAVGRSSVFQNFLGPGALATAAVGVGISRFMGARDARNDNTERVKNDSMTSGLEAYRNALNLATEATISMAERMKAAARDVANSADTYREARNVTQQDRAAARQDDEVIREYSGTNEQIAAQINALNVNGLQSQEMGAVKIDLLRQNYNEADVEDILGRVREATGGVNQMAGGTSSPTDARALAQGADQAAIAAGNAGNSGAGVDFSPGGEDWQAMQGRPLWDRIKIASGGIAAGAGGLVPDWLGGRAFEAGGSVNVAEIGTEAQNYVDAAVQGNEQRFAAQSEAYGNEYAQQQSFRGANEQFAEILKTGNQDLISRFSEDMSLALGTDNAVSVQADDVERYGSFTEALAQMDSTFEGVLKNARELGVTLEGAGVERNMALSNIGQEAYQSATNPNDLSGPMSANQMERQAGGSDALGRAFDNRIEGPNGERGPGANPVANAIRESTAQPADAQKFREAVGALSASMLEGGQAASEAGGQLFRLGQTVSEVLPEFQIIQAARQEVEFQQTANQPFQGQMTTFQQRFDRNAEIINSDANTASSDQEREAARKDQAAALADFAAYAKQRLQAQFQYQTQSERANEDYLLNVAFQRADFQKNMERQEEDFERNMARAERDFWRQRGRAEKQYNLSVQRSEADFYKNRMRTLRDFNKQMARAAEDGAKAFYDPYQRIQTQPSWSAEGLLMNFEEQLQAMEEQIANISRLRAAGLSQAAIDMLGLAESNNAQQAARLVADLQDSPETATRLNQTAQGRTAAAGTLNEENVSTRRSREDLQQSLKDQELDFRESMARSRADFNTSMAQSLEDYQRNVENQQADHNRLMSRAETDQQTALDRQARNFRTSLQRMETDFINSTKEILANETELAEATTKLLNGEAVEFDKLMVDSFKTTGKNLAGQIPSIKTQIEDAWGNGPTLNIELGTGGPLGEEGGTLTFSPSSEFGATQMSAASGSGIPTSGAITSGFGPRRSPGGIGSTNHKGIDYGVPVGTAVRTPFSGTVTYVGSQGSYGNLVKINHGGGRETRYAHLSGFNVAQGARVEAGAVIARSGGKRGAPGAGTSTGPHLHFETRQGGVALNPATALPTWRGAAQGGAFSGQRQTGVGGPDLSVEAVHGVGGPSVHDERVLTGTISEAAKTISGNYINKRDTQVINTNNSRTYVTHHNESHTYDQRTVVEKATVVAQDPNEMMRKLASKQRLSALSARGRART